MKRCCLRASDGRRGAAVRRRRTGGAALRPAPASSRRASRGRSRPRDTGNCAPATGDRALRGGGGPGPRRAGQASSCSQGSTGAASGSSGCDAPASPGRPPCTRAHSSSRDTRPSGATTSRPVSPWTGTPTRGDVQATQQLVSIESKRIEAKPAAARRRSRRHAAPASSGAPRPVSSGHFRESQAVEVGHRTRGRVPGIGGCVDGEVVGHLESQLRAGSPGPSAPWPQ